MSSTKRACDGCKIRKVRCGGGQPCRSCLNAGLQCTFIRIQQQRGPQQLRCTTRLLIEQTQRLSTSSTRIPLNVLATTLSIYQARLYPVWPVVDDVAVLATLRHEETEDGETYVLATALAAATMAQLRLHQRDIPGESSQAEALVAECLRVRSALRYRSLCSLHAIRTSFFLHVYYENQQPGGSESLLYLREAISYAQMMKLHRQSAYPGVDLVEEDLRRRVLWLLFVTERGVGLLHHLPIVLKTNICPPRIDDDSHFLPAFLNLLNLFRLLDQWRVFDMIQDDNDDNDDDKDNNDDYDNYGTYNNNSEQTIPRNPLTSSGKRTILATLQRQLQQDGAIFPLDAVSDVQKADLCVTRHWMRMILWKLSCRKETETATATGMGMRMVRAFPVMVATELLHIISRLPRSALEAHGLGMELKIYEIASSLADAVASTTSSLSSFSFPSPTSSGESLLARLHAILAMVWGGTNQPLVDMLHRKMAGPALSTNPALPLPLLGPSLLLHPVETETETETEMQTPTVAVNQLFESQQFDGDMDLLDLSNLSGGISFLDHYPPEIPPSGLLSNLTSGYEEYLYNE
ncbi:hypothetical protein ASPZODRAFT_132740 [Penicilliopsis zonata CBS 506.65]|uniref:Zn(2)-C6 fungal-type domain-containing protein n=1 Tax=Penicilliopsis zonata CBS 506.65 TaxID=1073090 RepID=A0A1L9SHP9_9EURO|nr:hypothetical protein ASPZODRAFT_132740 [Penicilliopsis zonata CBS 506.65]OJJ46643.1 hypothetical protein ASPZODRAFT_132740 [Penicilliopsis zonata CBS 506.65]